MREKFIPLRGNSELIKMVNAFVGIAKDLQEIEDEENEQAILKGIAEPVKEKLDKRNEEEHE